MSLDCVAPDEQTFNYWLDGINTLLRWVQYLYSVHPPPLPPTGLYMEEELAAAFLVGFW